MNARIRTRAGASSIETVGSAAADAFQTGTPSAAAGVQAISKIGQTTLAKDLSTAGRLVVGAAELAAGELADGDLESAAAITAASIVTGVSYEMGKAYIDQGLSAVEDVAGGVSAAVPIIGAIVNVFVQLAANPAGSFTPDEINQKCGLYFTQVVRGNGGSLTDTAPGSVLPADIFMAGATQPQTGQTSADVFGWRPGALGNKSPPDKYGGGSLARILRLLEDDVEEPGSQSAKLAKKAWPNAGLPAEARLYLKLLRLGISAGYVNTSIPRYYTPTLRDGGTTEWPVYADLLTSQFRWGAPALAPGSPKSRVPKEWLRWRLLHRSAAQSNKNNGGSADLLASAGTYEGMLSPALLFAQRSFQKNSGNVGGAQDPLQYVRSYVYDADVNFTLALGNCALFDSGFEREWQQLYDLQDYWFKGVFAPNPDMEFPTIGDGPPAVDGWRAERPLWPWLAVLAAGAGVFYATTRPEQAARVVRGANDAARRAAASVGRAARGAGAAVSGAARQAGTAVRGWQRRAGA